MISHNTALAVIAVTVAAAVIGIVAAYRQERRADKTEQAELAAQWEALCEGDGPVLNDPQATQVIPERHPRPRHQAEETREVATRGRRSREDRLPVVGKAPAPDGAPLVLPAAPARHPDSRLDNDDCQAIKAANQPRFDRTGGNR